jgi:hypothetical protein
VLEGGCDDARTVEFPLARVMSSEASLKRSRREYGALTASPTLLAFLEFGGKGIMRMAALAFLAVASIERQRHMEHYAIRVVPYCPTESRSNL